MRPEGSQFELASIVSAAQGGSVVAAHRLVERYQNDLLGIAYLLTGDRTAAADLAGDVCEQALAQLRGFDPEDDFYPWLLRHIPVALVAAGHRRTGQPSSGFPASAADSARYQVDDDRSRMRNALDLLTPRERLQLVLNDYAGLSESDAAAIAMILSGGDAEQRSRGEVRRRLRGLASLDDDESIANALRRAAVEAPRAPLWEHIEDAVEGHFARQRFRSRVSSLAAVAAALLLLGGVGLFLLYGALGSEGSAPTGAGASPLSTPTEVPATATPLPTATPSVYTPVGDVPDLLLYQRALAGTSWGLFNRRTGISRRLPEGELQGMSADGGTLLMLHQERHPDRVDMTLVAASSATGEELWRAAVPPAAGGGSDSVYFDLVVIDDLIYVASHDSSDLENILTIAVIELANGTPRDIWSLDVGVEFRGPGLDIDLFGTLQPQTPVLTVHIRSYARSWQKIQQIDLRSGSTLFASEPVRGLDDTPGQRLLGRDGRSVVVIPFDGLSAAPAVSYLTFDTMSRGEIALPFAPVEALDGVVVEYALSHDGRRLYALDIYNQQVAIIDLERRQVEQVVDLLGGEPARARRPGEGLWRASEESSGKLATLSPDGRYLYALSPTIELPGDPFPPGPGVWKIDTESWSIEAEWMPGGTAPVSSVFINADGSQLYVQRSGPGTGSLDAEHQTLVVNALNGEIVPSNYWLSMAVTGSLADYYREHYGRSPSVESVAPQGVPGLSAIPRVDVQIEPRSGPLGIPTDIEVRLLDPLTGDLLSSDVAADRPGWNPGALIATFSNGGERRTAVLGRSSDGSYRGRIALDLPGSWTLTLVAGDPESDGWSTVRPAAVQLIDATTGPDGRDYVLDILSFTGAPIAGQPIDLSVRIVPAVGIAATGVDDEVTLFLPSSIDLTLPNGTTTTLFHSGFLTYSGFVTFPSPGVIFPTVAFPDFGGQPVTLTARIEVADAE